MVQRICKQCYFITVIYNMIFCFTSLNYILYTDAISLYGFYYITKYSKFQVKTVYFDNKFTKIFPDDKHAETSDKNAVSRTIRETAFY